MRAVLLGTAAGGGYPQWNCGCRNCLAVRQGRAGFLPRTQCSLAVSLDGEEWAVIDASPDIRDQINGTPALHPREKRHSPVTAVLLTSAEIDHVAGLLTLREKQSFSLMLTREVSSILKANPVFQALDGDLVRRCEVGLDAEFDLLPGLPARLVPVPGKVPLYLEEDAVRPDLESGQTVAVAIGRDDRTIWYVPGCAAMTGMLADRLAGARTVLFDGTLWKDEELIEAGLSMKTGRRMGHMPMSGPGGSIEAFAGLPVQRKIYVHINNTNPVLDPSSPERQEAEKAGWEIGWDGMELEC